MIDNRKVVLPFASAAELGFALDGGTAIALRHCERSAAIHASPPRHGQDAVNHGVNLGIVHGVHGHFGRAGFAVGLNRLHVLAEPDELRPQLIGRIVSAPGSADS